VIEEKIEISRGKKKADLVIKNGKIVNVFSQEILNTDVAIYKEEIVGLGNYKGKKEIDVKGSYLLPGFIDGHLHLESSYLTPQELSNTLLKLGVTSAVIDPHEIANVLGEKGIRYILDEIEKTIFDFFVMLPSCVPATFLETSGSKIDAKDLKKFLEEKRVLGLAEMMNFPGVINCEREVLEKIEIFQDRIIDGHSPLLSGNSLCAYISAGIRSDHECIDIEEAKEKLRKGMYIMIREGTAAKNLETLISLITPQNFTRFIFVTDDRHPKDLLEEGSINFLIKKAIKYGIQPLIAISLGSINPANYFNLKKYGAIAPSYYADIVVVDNLENFKTEMVFKKGKLVVKDGKLILKNKFEKGKSLNIMKVDLEKIGDIRIKAESKKIRVIEIVPEQIITKNIVEEANIENGYVKVSLERDILKILVVERYTGKTNFSIGFVKGFGLKSGAIASSVAHDSHNIIIVGVEDEDILFALREIVKCGGGHIVVNRGRILEKLPLPIAGLISDRSIDFVNKKIENLNKCCKKLGCKLAEPFMSLSFLALPVIPHLKITDKGLVDVDEFKIVPLFC
jgi:adenine deaminase